MLIDFETRCRQRLANLTVEVRLHARDTDEVEAIHNLAHAVRLGQVQPRDAHASLVALRHDQRKAA